MSDKGIGKKTLLFLIFFLLTAILCFGSGYLTSMYHYRESEGITFNCQQDGIVRQSCNATVTSNINNASYTVVSNFNYVGVKYG